MATEAAFDYYYGDESNQFSFYRIPRQLITGDRFKRLSTDAKLLYGLLLDRMGLSAKNGWYDEQGRVFIYYTLDEIQEDLNCAHGKAVKLLSELDTGNGFGLIERIKQGQGRPTKIYVKRFTTREKPPQPAAPQDVPRLPIFGSQDFSKSEVKSSEKRQSRLPIIGSADFRKPDASYIKSNQTDFSYTDPSILPSGSQPSAGWMDRLDQRREVDEAIGYESLCSQYNREDVDEIAELIVDVAELAGPAPRLCAGIIKNGAHDMVGGQDAGAVLPVEYRGGFGVNKIELAAVNGALVSLPLCHAIFFCQTGTGAGLALEARLEGSKTGQNCAVWDIVTVFSVEQSGIGVQLICSP